MAARATPSFLSALAVAVATLATTACGDPDPPGQPTGNSSSGSTCPTGSTLTYENFGQGFFASYCVRCHGSSLSGTARSGAPTGYNWDDYDSIALHANEIDAMAAGGPLRVNTTMPPGDPRPTVAERRQLGQWLACELDVGR